MTRFEIIENPLKDAIKRKVWICFGVPEESRSAMEHRAQNNGNAQVIFGEKQVEYISKTEICIEQPGKQFYFKKGKQIRFFENGNFETED